MPADTRHRLPRRRLLQGLGAGVTVGVAGCLGDDDGDGDDGGTDQDDGSDGTDDDGTEPGDIQEGGRLEFGVERSGVDDYDQADSSLADDSTIFGAVYDGLLRQNPEGEVYTWMAEEYETVDAQDVSAEDYAPYMGEYEIVDVEDDFPILDLEWPNLDIIHHPDDLAAVAEGDLGAGDDFRVLTREEAGDAVADGVYGTQVSGRLHEGIEFHNGEECTAGNVVDSYDRFVGSQNQGQQFTSFLHAEAPEGEDGYEFELYAQEPDAIAELGIGPFWIFPSDHIDVSPGELDPREDGPVPVGTGPYEVAEFEEGTLLRLEKYDNYWLENLGVDSKEWFEGSDEFPDGPVIDEINIRFVPEGGQRTAALQDGNLDVSYELAAQDNTAFDEDSDFSVQGAASTGFLFLHFPIMDTDEGGAFYHQEVRQAVNQLIPRQDIVDIVEEGWASPAQAPFPEPSAGLGSSMSYEEVEGQDWAYPADPDVAAAEDLIDESPLEAPVTMELHTNADDEVRQDKMALIVDELSQSGLFEAVLETPADIGDWTTQSLYVEEGTEEHSRINAAVSIGLASGFDPHGYAEAIHHPNNYNICCNFFHQPGTFDFIDLMDSCRYGTDVAEDPDLRRERYDELWPEIAEAVGNTIIDYSLEVTVAGPAVNGYAGYPDRRSYLTYSIYDPYDEVVAWIDR